MTTEKFVGLDNLEIALLDLDSNYGWLSPGAGEEALMRAKMDDVVAALKAIQIVLLADDE